MDTASQYDIFEILPDGAPVWRGSVAGQDAALAHLDSLAPACQNELIAVHLATGALVARKPPKSAAPMAAPPRNGDRSPGGNTH